MNVRHLFPLLGLATLQCSAPSRSAAEGTEAAARAGVEVHRRVVDLSPATAGLDRVRREELPPVSRIPAGSTIFLRNVDPTRFCVVRLEGDLTSSRECATVTGFSFGARDASSHPIAPGGLASICFHDPGRYPLEVSGGAGPLVGVIEVFPR